MAGVLALFAGSHIQIPIKPVPFTLHTFVAVLMGLTYRPSHVLGSFAAFFTLGAFGFPMFSGFVGGAAVLVGPKGGYYLGMLACAYVMASLAPRARGSIVRQVALGVLGEAIIWALGWAQLSLFIGPATAFQFGVLPFVVFDTLKVLMAAGLVRWTRAFP